MKLTFKINDALDLCDEIPSTLEAIAHITIALGAYNECVNDERDTNTAYFLGSLLNDIADAITDYSHKEIEKDK